MGSSIKGSDAYGSSYGSSDQPKAVVLYEKVKTEIDNLKDSIDTTEAENLLKKVKLAIDIKDYSSAEENAKECVKKSHSLKKIYEDAAESLKTAWPEVKEARDDGRDVSRSDELIKEARRALRSKQPEKSKQLSTLAVDLLLTPTERKRKKCEEVRKKASATLEAVSAFGEIKGVGLLLVHEAESLISKGERSYAKEDYDTATQLYKKSDKSLNQLKEQYLYRQASDIYQKVARMVEDLEKKGKAIPGTSVALMKAKDALEYENYDEVIFQAIDIKKKIDEWEEEKSDEAAIQIITKAQFLLADLRKTGEEISHFEIKFERAKKALETDDYQKAEELGIEVNEEVQKLLDEINRRKAAEFVREVEHELAELRTTDISTTRFENDLDLAKRSLAQGNFKDSSQLLRKVLSRMNKARKNAIAPMMQKSIDDADKDIKKAKREGLDVLEPEDCLRRSRFAYETKSYEEVTKLIKNIEIFLKKERSKSGKKIVEYKKLIPEAMKAVQRLKEQKWNVDRLVSDLKKAPVLLKTKKYAELERVTVNVKTRSIAILKDEIILPAKDRLDEATTALKEAKKEGVDVKELVKELNEAMKLFTSKEYYKVSPKVDSIFKYIEELKEKASLQRSQIIIEYSEKLIKAYKMWKIKVKDLENIIKQANKAINDGDVSGATKLTRKLEKELNEHRQEFLKEQTDIAYKKAKKFINTADSDDKDQALIHLRQAQDKLEKGEYIKGWEIILDSNKEAGMDEQKYYRLKCDMAETIVIPRMSYLKDYDIDFEAVDGEFKSYKELYKNGEDFEEAYDKISEVASTTHNLEELTITNRALGWVDEISKTYVEDGYVSDDMGELLEQSRSQIEDQMYIDALKTMDEVMNLAMASLDKVGESYKVDEVDCPSCDYSVFSIVEEESSTLDCPVCGNAFIPNFEE